MMNDLEFKAWLMSLKIPENTCRFDNGFHQSSDTILGLTTRFCTASNSQKIKNIVAR